MQYKDIKLKKKLILAFSLIVAISTIPLLISIYSLIQMRATIVATTTENQEMVYLKDLKNLIFHNLLQEHKFLLTGDADYATSDSKIKEKIEALIETAAQSMDSEEEAFILRNIQSDIEVYESLFKQIENLQQQHRKVEALNILNNEHRTTVERVTFQLDELMADSVEDARKAVISAGEHTDSAVNLLILSVAISIGAITISILLAVILASSITTPVNRLKEAAEKISMGDLTASVNVDQKDEIGDLALSFKRMLTAIRFFALEMRKQNKVA